MYREEDCIKQGETIKGMKILNTSFALVCCDSGFVDTMKALSIFSGAFVLEYSVKFGDAGMQDIMDETSLCKYLQNRKWVNFLRYVRFAKLCLDDRAWLLLLQRLRTEGGMKESMSIWPPITRFCIALSLPKWRWW